MNARILACTLSALLPAACGGRGTPTVHDSLRYGADRQVAATTQLPASPANQSYDASVAPTDDSRGARIGSVISAQGGQKAQKEKEDQERAAFDAERNRQRAEQAKDPPAP